MTQVKRVLRGCVGSIFPVAARLFVTAFAGLILVLGFCGAQQTPVKPPTEVIPIAPGEKSERQIKSDEKPAYEFSLREGQYISARVRCRDIETSVGVDDPAGVRLRQFDGDTDGPDNLVEIAAETAGKYRIFILNNLTKPGVATCTIELGEARPATEKELSLQKAARLERAAWDSFRSGKFAEAQEPARTALALREKTLGHDASLVADSHMVVGVVDLRGGDFPSAEKELLLVLKIREARPDTRPVDLISILGNLGNFYNGTGDYDKAAGYLERTVSLLEKGPGTNDRYLALALDNLANTYYLKGDYKKSEPLYERALEIREKSVRPEDSDIGDTYNSLGNLHQAMGDFASAEKFYLRSVEAYEKQADQTRIAYALMGLGAVYSNLGQFEKAEAAEQRALGIFQQALGPEHPTIGNVFKNIAGLKVNEGELAKAEEYYRQALGILQKKLGEDNPDVAEALDGLGALYSREAEYAKAEPLLQKALAIREKALGPEHPDVVSTLVNLCALQSAKGNFAAAEGFLRKAITISEHNADLNLLAGSERQKLDYLDFLSEQLNQAVTLNVNFAPEQAAARDLAATAVLQRKGRVLDVLSESRAELRKNFNKDDVALLNDFDKVTAQLSRLVLGGPQNTSIEEHQKQIGALQEKREQLESEISRHSGEYAAALKPVTLEAVRATVPGDAALLEFVAYKKYPIPGKTEKESEQASAHYAVYVIRASGDVGALDLGESSKLDAAIASYREALRDANRDDVKQIARALAEKILLPLHASIGDATHLLVSADGQLNLIPFEALVDDQNRYLVERYSVTYLTSGRDLLRMQVQRKSKSELLVIANPDFGEPDATLSARAGEAKFKHASAATARRSITTGQDLSSVYFAPLGATAEEARSIQALFPRARVLSGSRPRRRPPFCTSPRTDFFCRICLGARREARAIRDPAFPQRRRESSRSKTLSCAQGLRSQART